MLYAQKLFQKFYFRPNWMSKQNERHKKKKRLTITTAAMNGHFLAFTAVSESLSSEESCTSSDASELEKGVTLG